MIRRWITPQVNEEDQTSGFDSFELRLGDVMRGERATLGKSLLDVQRELKIRATYISAIENADVTAFETPSFIAGYVRSYARYLGMDPEWAFNVFCRESGFEPAHGLSPSASSIVKTEKKVRDAEPADPLANPNATFVPRRSSIFDGIEPGAVGSVAVLAGIVGLLGFGGWSLLQEIQKVDFAPVEQSVGVLEDLPELDAPIGPTDGNAPTTVAGLNSPPSVEAMDRMYRPEALDVPVLIARDGPISTLDPRDVGVLPDRGRARDPQIVARAAPQPGNAIDAAVTEAVAQAELSQTGVTVFGPDAPDVAIFAVRPSWVRVKAADGSTLFEKILDAGERYVLPKTETAPTLRTGNAGSVYFAVNGQAYGPVGEGASVVSDVALAPDAIHESFAVADITADQDLANFVAVADASE